MSDNLQGMSGKKQLDVTKELSQKEQDIHFEDWMGKMDIYS